ncbi:hypothetical protein SAMN05216238_107106 [Lentibacillus persicus]|uniref:YgjP-like metallopeptidase domain-containing protein n=1 Tax=Lentibacillus persicus TaxID=640948 RepID=A0A1I1X9N7_9BACI|nr:SprT family zinc-dependent metalloprotease [Lentibacillus persicus]SFE02453.1 hypothetical protein SAMN05216238_107106 [Lentibacillus persicus]
MPTLKYGTTPIDYILYRQERDDLIISVTLVNGVEVYAPEKTDTSTINHHLNKKAPWIYEKIKSLKQVETSIQPKEFVSGEKLPYLGRHYRLKVNREPVSAARLTFYQGRFIATVPKNWPQKNVHDSLEEQLVQWYRKQAAKKLRERSAHYAKLLNTRPASISIRTQHKRWGTCTPEGDIYINWRLIMAPLKIMDYVIVHELAHLIVQDHSPEFWKIVKSILPDYEERKEWLRVNGMGLHCIG